MILIHRHYSEVTPESAAEGDTSDTGTLARNEPVTFRELVDLMREHPQASSDPHQASPDVWFSSGWSTTCYRTGTERQCSLHYSRDNPERHARYWRLASIAAGHRVQHA